MEGRTTLRKECGAFRRDGGEERGKRKAIVVSIKKTGTICLAELRIMCTFAPKVGRKMCELHEKVGRKMCVYV